MEGPRFDDLSDLEFELKDVERCSLVEKQNGTAKCQLFRFENLGIFF